MGTRQTTTIKMKFTTATIAILATAVSAQSIAELTASIPACAQTCLATAIGNSGCGVDDNACQCGDANAAITREATPCVISGCSSEEALNTQSITSQICALVAAGGSSGGSSAASSAATSAASSVSSAASSAASSVSEAATATTSAPVEATTAASKEKVGSFMAGAAILAAIAL